MRVAILYAKQFVLSLSIAILSVTSAFAATITVFAAASLKESLDDAAKSFEQLTGDKVVISYAASSALAKQIENGAPAEIFFSADTDWMDYLIEKKQIRSESRVDLLGNRIVLISPATPTAAAAPMNTAPLVIAANFPLAQALGNNRLSIADPKAVPAGKYAKAALESLGVWASVEQKLAPAENVRAALAFVARGETPFGVVYKTDALAEKRVRIVDTFPPFSHVPIVYPVALTNLGKSEPAIAFLNFLKAPQTRVIWEKYGFTVRP
jgi:molybdate transport system substrate-binding protein